MRKLWNTIRSWDIFTLSFWTARGVIPRWQLLAAYLLILGVFVVSTSRLHDESVKTTGALCSLRHELERRVLATDEFLNNHPQGAFGFTPAQLRKSENDTKRTILALSSLDCSDLQGTSGN